MKLTDKLKNAVSKHSGKVEKGIDKGADFADKRTGGKHSDKLGSATDKAKGYMNKLKRDRGDGPQQGGGGH